MLILFMSKNAATRYEIREFSRAGSKGRCVDEMIYGIEMVSGCERGED